MLKYVDTLVSFQEVPDEISLCINISNCPNHCKGCHSQYLLEDIGKPLTDETLQTLIKQNTGISCVCLMGGDKDPQSINELAKFIHTFNLKVGWYSGKNFLSKNIDLKNFDYVKIGQYQEELGPLNNPNTNQKMFKINHQTDPIECENITYKFWK